MRPVTPLVAGTFFAFATLLVALAGVSLLFPGGPLDAMWRIKPREHAQLLTHAPLVGTGFLLLGMVMGAASIGCFARRHWGWILAVTIFVANGVADLARIPLGAPGEGLLGAAITGLLVWWLTRPRVHSLFRAGAYHGEL